MKAINGSLISLSIALILSGCDDETLVVEEAEDTYSAAVTENYTLTNTDDIVYISEEEVDTLTINIGATTDLHGRLYSYDYALDSEDYDAGLTRIATLLASEKAADPNMLMIDIGDTVQGNSASLFNDEPTHPMVDALNELDFDVWVPGNHEFNFERSFIDRNLETFNGAVISSNIKWEESDVNYIRAYQVFSIDGATVAIVGLTPSNVPNWEASSPSHFQDLAFDEELEATTAAVEELVETYDPDVIIGALHIGRNSGTTGGVYEIASELAEYFDVIFAGHEHATYIESVAKSDDGSVNEGVDISIDGESSEEDKTTSGTYSEENRTESVKIIGPGYWGARLAKASIELEKDDDGEWQLVDTTLTNTSTYGVDEDETLQAQFAYVYDTSIEDAQTVIGEVSGNFVPTTTGYADEATEEDYNSDITYARLYSTIHKSKVEDSPLLDFINQIQISKTQATVSAAALFADYSNLVDGQEYAKMDSTSLYKYDNTLMGINISGENLKRYMEWSYSYFNGYQAGDLTVSFNEDKMSYNYDQFDGDLTYEVDLTGDAFEMDDDYSITNEGSRVTITSIGGEEFDTSATYTLAVNSYRWGTHIQTYGWADEDDVYYESTDESVYAIRDMLTEYVEENYTLSADTFTNENWSIVQLQDNGAITLAREDGGVGQTLWEQLQNKEICVIWTSDSYPGISVALNPDNADSYYENPNKDSDDLDEIYEGCAAISSDD